VLKFDRGSSGGTCTAGAVLRRNGMDNKAPIFRKHDRYKASSYRAYNFKMPTRYDSSFWMTFCQARLQDRTIISELGPGIASLAILDVGCATGRLLSRLAASGAQQLFGVDLAPNILEVARESLAKQDAHPELHAVDAEDSLPWPSESFDVVTLTGVLHHFYRPHDALRQIHRVLRSGGRVLVLDPCFFPPLRHLMNLCLRVAPHEGDYRFYSPRGALRLLQSVGYRCSRPRRVGLWNYLVAGEKLGEDKSAVAA
jgi:ubiquinone/menaquinone biosynthesis C-methylase UbiE